MDREITLTVIVRARWLALLIAYRKSRGARHQMKEIRSDPKNIQDLLSSGRFGIDYYQREYRWEEEHVTELIGDLADSFMKSYSAGDNRRAVRSYEIYFLGTIIVSDVHDELLIVDGQQRLTSLTLLLIALHRRLPSESSQRGTLQNLIFADDYGVNSYTLNVPDRRACIDALYRGNNFDASDADESVTNILARYEDIQEQLPESVLKSEVLPLFVDWVCRRVFLVEITAYTDVDAYTMFESMNDRGLSLTPAEMLRGYLLSKIDDIDARQQASESWKRRSDELNHFDRHALENAVRAWLRSQHAENMTGYDEIGTGFNRWVRDNESDLGLINPPDFADFVTTDFDFYAKWYGIARRAAEDYTFARMHGLEAIRYNSWNNFTLQYPALLTSLVVHDDDDEVFAKFRLVSKFIDALIARRAWGYSAINESYMRSRIFNSLITAIRGLNSNELAASLENKLESYNLQFEGVDFALHQMNRRRIHYILARFADFIGTRSGEPTRFEEFMAQGGRDPFEIEHIWADDFERDGIEFGHPHDFSQYRNRIGGLVLLPKSFNQSFGALPYAEKYPHYFGQNYLAKTLHKQTYERNPGFLRFKEKTGLAFHPHIQFAKSDLDERQELYRQMALRIWSADSLLRVDT